MHRPERYNAKARAGGSHKKGKVFKKKNAAPSEEHEDTANTNADIVEHKSEADKEAERKLKMRQQLLEESNSKASSKKKKRLDKYIDKKLKKEERLELFEKLARSQSQLPTTVHLHSSSTLGTGRPSTALARIEKEEDREMRHAIEGSSKKRKRHKFSGVAGHHTDSSDSSDEFNLSAAQEDRMSVDIDEHSEIKSTAVVVIEDSSHAAEPTSASSAPLLGGALRRNADGTVVQPRLLHKKEKGQRTILRKWKRGTAANVAESQYESDGSFDSSDSAYDSSNSSTGDGPSEDASLAGSDAENGEEIEDAAEAEGVQLVENRPSTFKQWATAQLSTVRGYVAPTVLTKPQEFSGLHEASPYSNDEPLAKKQRTVISPQGEKRGPLGEDFILPSTSFSQSLQNSGPKASSRHNFVPVTRPAAVEEARLLLPIITEEQQIVEAILLNPVVVICGETGSGKTTQVPQFLYEAGFGSPGSDNPGMIGVTQPRRVAAMSMASRVAHELSLSSSRISYQIRYDATVSPSTSIKFMTDGVLLRELATDFLLSKYSVIIIDEAHERSMNTDILIGVLSRVIKLREDMWKEKRDSTTPLRLIIMSATLRISDFTENKTLFSEPPPVISVAARQHPVTIHFNRRTVSDYTTEAVKKASKIHARLPPGGILIFLTGQNEIAGVCRKLEEKYGAYSLEERKRRRTATQQRTSAQTFFSDSVTAKPAQAALEAEDMDLGLVDDTDLAADVDGDGEDDEEALDTDDDAEDRALGIDLEESEVPMHIIPLYSLLPSEKQMKVFEPPPAGTRLVVVSTNIAETSLTIPGIRYVIDCGRAKERKYTTTSGIQSFQVGWISKASAAQRAGRAGRTGPGHCYRLYSSAVFENYFDQFSEPEIIRVPIEGVVLQMKSMHIDAVVNFPFPTPPNRTSLLQAQNILSRLGALKPPDGTTKESAGGQITDLGRTMSLFPLSPRFSRMLVGVGDPFIREEAIDNDSDEDEDGSQDEMVHLTSEKVRVKERRKLRRKTFFQSQQLHSSLGGSTSDLFRTLSVIGAYEYAGGGLRFCSEHFAMDEIHKLRAQISNIVSVNFPGMNTGFVPNLQPPTEKQLKILRQLLAAGFIDQVAVRKDLVVKDAATGNKYTTARGVAYRALGVQEDVFIHPSSILANSAPPDYIVFHEIVRTTRVWLKGLTVVNSAWLASLGKPLLCTFSRPFKNRTGELMVTPRFGPEGWEMPAIKASVQ